tara:strand:- start:401 stop:547 length:147 start_codon:yes stop_codon:yes gene_type:complete
VDKGSIEHSEEGVSEGGYAKTCEETEEDNRSGSFPGEKIRSEKDMTKG